RLLIAVLTVATLPIAAAAQTPSPAPFTPIHIPTPSGEVILPTAFDKQAYDEYGYAPIRRAGNLVFISGVVVGRRPTEGTDVEAFKAQVRRKSSCTAPSPLGPPLVRPRSCLTPGSLKFS
ncbi:MAG TPA: hypothetical protein VFE70_01290, partial [Candidatus Elarobacter sp.]|nr:hypothetical protein [Candidatus Elarobacter sp.]